MKQISETLYYVKHMINYCLDENITEMHCNNYPDIRKIQCSCQFSVYDNNILIYKSTYKFKPKNINDTSNFVIKFDDFTNKIISLYYYELVDISKPLELEERNTSIVSPINIDPDTPRMFSIPEYRNTESIPVPKVVYPEETHEIRNRKYRPQPNI